MVECEHRNVQNRLFSMCDRSPGISEETSTLRLIEVLPMQQRTFGKLGDISALTLGGGGIGQVWGPTTREEAIATVRTAWEAGLTLFDVAPSYGRGEAEVVLGETFGGRLPAGVRVSTKCAVGHRAAREALPLLERSLDESLARLKLDRVDLFFVHNQIVPDASTDQIPGTPYRLFVEAVRP